MSVNPGLTDRGFETTTGLVTKQGLFQESATPNHSVGTRVQLADGRVFFYSKAGAGALGLGKNTQVAVVNAAHVDIVIADEALIGVKSFTVTDGGSGIAANQFAEGYLSINSGGGLGQMLKIKSNTVAGSGADSVVKTYDPNTVALGSTPTAILTANPWMGGIQGTAEEAPSIGVPLISVTAAYYYWSQTWGISNVLRGDTAAIGARLGAGDVAGELLADSATYNPLFPPVGISLQAGVDGDYQPVMLTVHP